MSKGKLWIAETYFAKLRKKMPSPASAVLIAGVRKLAYYSGLVAKNDHIYHVPEIAPSEELLDLHKDGRIGWEEYRKKVPQGAAAARRCGGTGGDPLPLHPDEARPLLRVLREGFVHLPPKASVRARVEGAEGACRRGQGPPSNEGRNTAPLSAVVGIYGRDGPPQVGALYWKRVCGGDLRPLQDPGREPGGVCQGDAGKGCRPRRRLFGLGMLSDKRPFLRLTTI